jgi:uncharacterized protein with HEPN domain
VTEDQKDVLLSLLGALKRAQRKSQSLIANPELLDQEEGEDALDVICMQFLAAGESLKRLERLYPGLLQNRYPHIDWKGAMGFGDVIAHQYFDLDVEQVLVICEQSLPGLILAVQDLLENG